MSQPLTKISRNYNNKGDTEQNRDITGWLLKDAAGQRVDEEESEKHKAQDIGPASRP